jgi:hypothetical protein
MHLGSVFGQHALRCLCLLSCAWGLPAEQRALPLQVFIPREDLSLDVIKQYRVVSVPPVMAGCSEACALLTVASERGRAMPAVGEAMQ